LVPDSWIRSVFQAIIDSGSKATFLFLTKNPIRYFKYIDLYQDNMVFGATIETNYITDLWYEDISKAPNPCSRIYHMRLLHERYDFLRLFISIEPIMAFNGVASFTHDILAINPEFVYIGYDNYSHRLPEPTLEETNELIERLRMNGVEVRIKTLPREEDKK